MLGLTDLQLSRHRHYLISVIMKELYCSFPIVCCFSNIQYQLNKLSCGTFLKSWFWFLALSLHHFCYDSNYICVYGRIFVRQVITFPNLNQDEKHLNILLSRPVGIIDVFITLNKGRTSLSLSVSTISKEMHLCFLSELRNDFSPLNQSKCPAAVGLVQWFAGLNVVKKL